MKKIIKSNKDIKSIQISEKRQIFSCVGGNSMFLRVEESFTLLGITIVEPGNICCLAPHRPPYLTAWPFGLIKNIFLLSAN